VTLTSADLLALDELSGRGGTWEIDGHRVNVTNLDKVLFPGHSPLPDLTKRDLIRYYATIAPVLLPYLERRPVNLHRYPDGIRSGGFWHKASPAHAPDWLATWKNPDARPGETRVYTVLDSVASLVWAANFAAIELNPWTSTTSNPHQPTWAMIDLDPGDRSTFDDVVVLARLHRVMLEHLGVRAAAKVTGKRGIQIWVPIADGYSFADTRSWVERLSRTIAEVVPDMVSWEWTVAKREGRIRLDYTQNAVNKTLVAPFSVRPAAGGPVSVPIAWSELEDPELRPDGWTIRSVMDRLAHSGDPLAELIGLQQRLPTI
jgi:bifunctional non-homologous end joining protein LigD